MDNRIAIPILCTAALAYACGPWMHSASTNATTSNAATSAMTSTTSTGAVIANSAQTTPNSMPTPTPTRQVAHPKGVNTTLGIVSRGSEIAFTLAVVNNTKKTVELRFPNGQTHEFAVLDSLGRTVWRWSDGRLFTQAMQSKTVGSRDTLLIEDAWDATRARGTYIAVATLMTDHTPIERRTAFTIR